jgi:hypothetical protein
MFIWGIGASIRFKKGVVKGILKSPEEQQNQWLAGAS